MSTSETRWTAIDGSRVRYIEGGRRSGPDVLLIPLHAGLASEEAVWSAIVTVGRAVAVDLPGDGLSTPGAMVSFVMRAIEVLRLRHLHFAASFGARPLLISAVGMSSAIRG